MSKPKIAIACQGGGSQTAFTAGVLKAVFDSGIHHETEIIALTGTSGAHSIENEPPEAGNWP
jgi:NTE family protein